MLTDIDSQVKRRESELINLWDFLKAVNPKAYPDSAAEYTAYQSLINQINEIKTISNDSKNSGTELTRNYQLESAFRRFELDYQAHINAIQSLCYLSEISLLNKEMYGLFHSNFTSKTEDRIDEIEDYITLISQKNSKFDKKYATRLYKELIDAEYRLTILKLMTELKRNNPPRRNPFSSFSAEKKKTFETYLSGDLREDNIKYNAIADNKKTYVKYHLVKEELFDSLDEDAGIISTRVNKYTIDDFLLTEMLDNGEGYETLKNFLRFKLKLNFIDSKTQEANQRDLDDTYEGIKAATRGETGKRDSFTTGTPSRNGRRNTDFPDFYDE